MREKSFMNKNTERIGGGGIVVRKWNCENKVVWMEQKVKETYGFEYVCDCNVLFTFTGKVARAKSYNRF